MKKHTYHDLDRLVGTWFIKEAKEFEKNVQFFEKIDSNFLDCLKVISGNSNFCHCEVRSTEAIH